MPRHSGNLKNIAQEQQKHEDGQHKSSAETASCEPRGLWDPPLSPPRSIAIAPSPAAAPTPTAAIPAAPASKDDLLTGLGSYSLGIFSAGLSLILRVIKSFEDV